MFCEGSLIVSSFILLPVHCLVAGKHLNNFQYKVWSSNASFINVDVDEDLIMVHPQFSKVSYTKTRFLSNDIALVPLNHKQQNLKNKKISFNSFYDLEYFNFKEVDKIKCDLFGLARNQVCLQRTDVVTENSSAPVKYGDQLLRFRYDPRTVHYYTASFHKTGRPVLDKNCHLQGMILRTNFDKSLSVVLQIESYRNWIASSINTHSIKTKTWNKTKELNSLFLEEISSSNKCSEPIERIEEDQDILPQNTVEPESPSFTQLTDNMRVITDCGVEIRLESGIIHSPIHFRDVKNSRELLELLQNDYRYRPNQRCEWVITAPSQHQKVGLRFKFFDLHPDFDRLEIEEDGETRSASELANFRAGEETRTIISGTDQVKLTFYSDYYKEKKGFALTFQPVNVTQCGGSFIATSGRIQSPNYPFFYPPNTVCIWKIQVLLGFDIKNLSFIQLCRLLEIP